MLKKRIKALKDFTLNTRIDTREFNKGDVVIIKFESEKQFTSLLAFGNFTEVHNPVKVVNKPMPTSVSPDGRPMPPRKDPIPVISKGKEPIKVEEKVKGNVCGHCDRSFATIRGLAMHMARSHKDLEPKVEEHSEAAGGSGGSSTMTETAEPKVEKVVGEPCPNCQSVMVVQGEEAVPGKGVKVTLICSVCGVKKEILR